DGIRALARTLADFEPATTTLEPEHTRDLLKKLYQYLVPRKLRHDLGEYYTPDWLAERLLNQVGYKGEPDKRLIDPGCGSGTFLILALRRLRQYAADHLIPPADVLDAALRNIVGFDLNPLSVIAARTNYLLALGDLLRYRRGPVDLPVYMCDSIMTPTERADMFGKSYRLRTVVGDFDIPGETVAVGEMGPLSSLLESCVRDQYTPQEFLARARRELTVSEAMTESVLEGLYRQLYHLDEEGRNGLWARLLKNAFAPVLVGEFDFVVGNPPWVNWESLSAEYREATKRLWEKYEMQAQADGKQFALGKVKRDISMLFTFVCIDKYLRPKGRLGFVITQTVFKTRSGEVFRAFRVGPDVPFRVTHVDDMVALQPFEGASNWTSVFVCEKGRPTRYPVPYTLWRPLPRQRIALEDTLAEVITKTKRSNFKAKPVRDDQPTSPWITAYPQALKAITGAIGESDYTARAGVVTWADGIYWVKVLDTRPDGALIIENLGEAGKRKIETVQAAVEPDLLYPFARWTDISRWRANPSCYILLPHTPESGWRAIDEGDMKVKYPLTYSYLKRFEPVLLRRSGYVQLRQGQPFYILSNTGNWLYASWKVGWKRMGTKMEAAVLQEVDDPLVGKKPLMSKETVVYVACESEQEAHYLCAMLNSSITNFTAKSYSVGKSFGSPHLLKQVNIPHFDPNSPIHTRLAALSQQAHQLAAGDEAGLAEVEAQVDEAAAELWGITDRELKEIQRSLEELG
ncbi:MAG: N-6 DNA methylase, partial [Anaerolineae bacterium]